MPLFKRLLRVPLFAAPRDRNTAAAELSFFVEHLTSLADYESYLQEQAPELARRSAVERQLAARNDDSFEVGGHCFVCGKPSSFAVSYAFSYEVDGVLTPNWREHLKCRRCGLWSRIRASLHLLATEIRPPRSGSLYITEQLGPIYQDLKSNYAEVVGSEFLRDGTACGEVNAQGVRHEDLTRLSFASERFDCVISFDVLEHVPSYSAGLRECHRILRPGGSLLLSTPFLPGSQQNLVRARVQDDGTIEHLLPPEYHGDPLAPEGCLAFYQFGWELVEQLREIGFSRTHAVLYWSRDFAYLGRDQIVFVAVKNGG